MIYHHQVASKYVVIVEVIAQVSHVDPFFFCFLLIKKKRSALIVNADHPISSPPLYQQHKYTKVIVKLVGFIFMVSLYYYHFFFF